MYANPSRFRVVIQAGKKEGGGGGREGGGEGGRGLRRADYWKNGSGVRVSARLRLESSDNAAIKLNVNEANGAY